MAIADDAEHRVRRQSFGIVKRSNTTWFIFRDPHRYHRLQYLPVPPKVHRVRSRPSRRIPRIRHHVKLPEIAFPRPVLYRLVSVERKNSIFVSLESAWTGRGSRIRRYSQFRHPIGGGIEVLHEDCNGASLCRSFRFSASSFSAPSPFNHKASDNSKTLQDPSTDDQVGSPTPCWRLRRPRRGSLQASLDRRP